MKFNGNDGSKLNLDLNDSKLMKIFPAWFKLINDYQFPIGFDVGYKINGDEIILPLNFKLSKFEEDNSDYSWIEKDFDMEYLKSNKYGILLAFHNFYEKKMIMFLLNCLI